MFSSGRLPADDDDDDDIRKKKLSNTCFWIFQKSPPKLVKRGIQV